jgi:hypothetical protein
VEARDYWVNFRGLACITSTTFPPRQSQLNLCDSFTLAIATESHITSCPISMYGYQD